MNKFLKILFSFVALVVLAIASVMFFTADMVSSADEFFTHVKQHNTEKAYDYLSEDFQANTSKVDLEKFLEKNLIHEFNEASWDSRSINGGRGTLTGSISTLSGGVIPITLSFVKSENGWKIYSIQKPSAGIQEESSSLELPSEEEQIKLISKAVLIFAKSVNENSMVKFHSHTANLWQQNSTVEEFDEIFQNYYELGLDLTILKNFTPIFQNKPSINEEGFMVITGHYPTKPQQFHFKHTYVFEGLGWKLVGFSAEIK